MSCIGGILISESTARNRRSVATAAATAKRCANTRGADMRTERGAILMRRQFLRVLGVGAVATASAPLATPAAAERERGDEARKARYRETDHVKAYYRVNRYPR